MGLKEFRMREIYTQISERWMCGYIFCRFREIQLCLTFFVQDITKAFFHFSIIRSIITGSMSGETLIIDSAHIDRGLHNLN